MTDENEDDDFESDGDDMLDDFETVEVRQGASKKDFNARRRLEQLKEDKRMARLLSNEVDDWYDDLSDNFNDNYNDKFNEIFYDDLY